MTLSKPSPLAAPADNFARLGAACDAIDAAVLDLQALKGSVARDFDALAAATSADYYQARGDIAQSGARPGEAPALWTSRIEGPAATCPPLSDSLVVTDSDGAIVRLTSAMSVGPIAPLRIEPGRVYLIRFVVRRRVNAVDPANDAVRLGLRLLTSSKGALSASTRVLSDVLTLSAASGRQIFSFLVSTAPGDGIVALPAGTIYARPFVQTFTGTPTDIEVLERRDVTGTATVPDLGSAYADRIASLEASRTEFDPRIAAVEAVSATPNTLTFASVADAQSRTVPNTVNSFRLLGYYQAGDKGGAIYTRVAQQPQYAGIQTADGSWWAIAEPQISVLMVGADPTGVADSAVAFATASNLVPDRGPVQVPDGTYRIDAFALGAARTWVCGGSVSVTGAYPRLPGQIVRLGLLSLRGTGQALFGTLTDYFEPQFYALTGGRVSTAASALVGLSTFGNIGLAGGSRSSDVPGTGAAEATIGTYGGAVNDWSGTNKRSAYAFYGDATRLSGAGTTHFLEGDVINFGSMVPVSPNGIFAVGATLGSWMASGGGVASGTNPASAAFAVVNNGNQFDKGLVFHDQSLTRRSGLGEAISFGLGHYLQWYTQDGTQTTAIVSNVTNTGRTLKQVFDNGGFSITYPDGSSMFTLWPGDATINSAAYIQARRRFYHEEHVVPSADNVSDFGQGGNRIRNIFLASPPIVSSDASLKVVRGALTETEVAAIREIEIVVFQYRDALAQKGDKARLHTGVIAQQVVAAFVKHGLDPFAYGVVGRDAEVVKEERRRIVRRPRMRDVPVQQTEFVREGGQFVARAVTVTHQEAVLDWLPVVDEAGAAVMTHQAVRDADGRIVLERVEGPDGTEVEQEKTEMVPLLRAVPVEDQVEETYTVEIQQDTGRLNVRYEELAMMMIAALRP